MTPASSTTASLWRSVLPWPLVGRSANWTSWAASIGLLLGVLLSRLLLLPDGPWEQDEALIACGVVDFDPAHHMPLPPGFPLWVLLGRVVRLLGVNDPLTSLQVASAVLSLLTFWVSVGLWDRYLGRSVAVSGALLGAFLPGVWFHAARGFSETPATALAIIAFAFWLGGSERGFATGAVAMSAAALVRPPLAPFFVVAVLLASWGVRRRPRRLLEGGIAATALAVLVLVPLIREAGGWELFWAAGATHAREHFSLLGTEATAFADFGYVRGLAVPWAAILLAALALLGWLALRRRLGWRWTAGTLAGCWLLFLLLVVHNRTYPRYWVPVWLLAAPVAVHGLAVLLRSRRVAATLAVGAAALAAFWSWPAVAWLHQHAAPAVAALRVVGAESRGVLIFDDELFSFRNLAARQGLLQVSSMRVSEIPPRRLAVGGETLWFLTQGPGIDAPASVSRVVAEAVVQPRVRKLSQERFLEARLVRDPVLTWRGGSIPELEGTRRFVWCAARTLLLVPPLSGGGTLTLAVEIHHLIGETEVVARVAGRETMRRRAGGRTLLQIPIPALPERNNLRQVVPVEIEVGGEVELPGDRRPLAFRIFACSVEAPPHTPRRYSVFGDPKALLAAAVRAEGVHGPELMGDPRRSATWLSPEARFELPLGRGAIEVELLAPRPGPVPTELRLGTSSASLLVGPDLVRVVLSVPEDLAARRRGALTVRSVPFVPGGADLRELGVALHRITFIPDPLAVDR